MMKRVSDIRSFFSTGSFSKRLEMERDDESTIEGESEDHSIHSDSENE